MTTENFIPQSEETMTEQEPIQTTEVESNEPVEADQVTNLMSGTDTSTKSIDWEKRYKDLQSFQSKRENELRDKIKGLESVEPTTQAAMEAQGIEAPAQTIEKDAAMTEFANAQAQIAAVHPDFMSTVQSAEFTTWASNQPASVQQWIYKNPDNPELAIIALDRYKATLATAPAKVEEVHPEEVTPQAVDNSAAMAVGNSSVPQTGEGKKIWKGSEIKKMHSSEWAIHSKDIEAAYAEGRVNFKA